MNNMNEYGGLITILVLLVAAVISAPSLFGFRAEQRTQKQQRKTRAQHEAELDEFYREVVNPAPLTKAELGQMAKEENEAYIDHAAAHAMRTSWSDNYGNHWEEYVIDRNQRRVVTHNSEGTGTRD